MDKSLEVLKEGVAKFVTFSEIDILPTSGGINNIVKKVVIDGQNEYILRSYNNGCDFNKVIFEHRVLHQLQKLDLSFRVPEALQSISDQQRYARLSDGSAASLFHVISGTLPKLSHTFSIGQACGELTVALASISVEDMSPLTPPYCEFFKAHHCINREKFYSYMASSALDEHRDSANIAVAEIIIIEDLVSSLTAQQLPLQLIHGDLNYDNMLVDSGKVSGVLDFEFCAQDWRAMDLAICLSKYAGERDPMPFIQDVIAGYAQFVTLSDAEVASVADLTVLSILSNVVYFVGRALSQEDVIDTLTSRLDNYLQRIQWLRSNKDKIVQCFSR